MEERQQRPFNMIVNLLFLISSQLFGPTGHKKEKKKTLKWFRHSFADLCIYIIVVCGNWDGLLGHRIVRTTRKKNF